MQINDAGRKTDGGHLIVGAEGHNLLLTDTVLSDEPLW